MCYFLIIFKIQFVIFQVMHFFHLYNIKTTKEFANILLKF